MAVSSLFMVRKSKYNTGDITKRTYNGVIYDSALEIKYLREVIEPGMAAGDIAYWERQKKYILQDGFTYRGKRVLPITYVADFYVVFADGREQVVDTKGCADPKALIKRKMFWFRYPDIDYLWAAYSRIDGGWMDYDAVQHNRSIRRKAEKENSKKENKDL